MNKSFESHFRISIGEPSSMRIAKHVLAREIIERGSPPSMERVKTVARLFGFNGDMELLLKAAEEDAKYHLQFFAPNPELVAADTVFCFQETAKTALLSMRSGRRPDSSSLFIRIVRAFRRWLRNLDEATRP